jgi:hypothetical protein
MQLFQERSEHHRERTLTLQEQIDRLQKKWDEKIE